MRKNDWEIIDTMSDKNNIPDAQTKTRISEIYHQFGLQMNDHLGEAVQVYLDGLRQAEAVSNPEARERLLDYTHRKFEQDCNLIEDLANDVLQNIYAELQIRL